MVSLLAVMACDRKPHDLAFQVSFVCPEDQAAADTLELRVLEGGCDGGERAYEASLAPGELAPVAKGLAPGHYGFEAVAFEGGEELAKGCVEATLPTSDAPIIALRSDTCTDAVVFDAGEDAGGEDDAGEAGSGDMDAASMDAQPSRDAAPGSDADAAPGTPDADTGTDAEVDASADAAADGEGPDAAPIACTTDCRDSFPCTEDRCVNGECVHEPYTGTRECDGIACTQNDRCESGSCKAGSAVHAACPDDGDPCTAETCVPGSGCNRQNASNTTSCNDRVGCTGPDRCNNGICRGADMCGDGGVCSAASGTCSMCKVDTDCNDGDPCNAGHCNGGKCSYTRNVGLAGVCTDNNSCTDNDVCTATGCAGTSTCPGDAMCNGSNCLCNDANEDYCDSSNTCVNLTNDAAHCGQCDRACGNGGSCERSACKPSDASNCSAWRYNGHEYLICPAVNGMSNWAWARDKCKSWGLGLAIINDANENTFLADNDGGADHWMAANDRGDNGGCGRILGCNEESDECIRNQEEGSWYWASSTSDNFRKLCTSPRHGACTPEPGAYTNFRGPDEPNNDTCNCGSFSNCSEGEDCGVIYADGTWNDGRCSNVLGFICETP